MVSGLPRRRVLVVGDVNPDIVVRTHGPPRFDQVEQLVEGIEVTLGGSAGIAACGTARLGLSTTLVAAVGEDDWGRWCTEQLTSRGVHTSALRTVPTATGATVLLVPGTGGGRAILTSPGAIGQLSGDDVGDAVLAGHGHLHLCSMFLIGQLRPDLSDVCRRARRAGLRISLDPNYDPSGRWDVDDELLAAVDLLLVNAVEAAALAGGSEIGKAAQLLGERCETVLVKDGARGAVLAHGGELTRIAAPEVNAVDCTGAGDSLAAGVIYGLEAGWTVIEAAALGVACGSASVRALGGTSAQPTFAEADALRATVGARGQR